MYTSMQPGVSSNIVVGVRHQVPEITHATGAVDPVKRIRKLMDERLETKNSLVDL